MTQRKDYPDEFKREAVRLAQERGNLAATARDLGNVRRSGYHHRSSGWVVIDCVSVPGGSSHRRRVSACERWTCLVLPLIE